MKLYCVILAGATLLAAPSYGSYKDDDYEIDVNNKGFETLRIEVPANTRIKIEVDNESDNIVDFYIADLDIQQSVPSQTEREFWVDGFAPGEYRFENLMNSTMQGTLVAK